MTWEEDERVSSMLRWSSLVEQECAIGGDTSIRFDSRSTRLENASVRILGRLNMHYFFFTALSFDYSRVYSKTSRLSYLRKCVETTVYHNKNLKGCD